MSWFINNYSFCRGEFCFFNDIFCIPNHAFHMILIGLLIIFLRIIFGITTKDCKKKEIKPEISENKD